MDWCLIFQGVIFVFAFNIAVAVDNKNTASVVTENKCLINVTGSAATSGRRSITTIPDTFHYVCKADGTMHINISQFGPNSIFNIRGIEPSPNVLPPHCQNFTCNVSGDTVIVTVTTSDPKLCQHGVPVLLEFDKLAAQSKNVAGGNSTKRFMLTCSSFNQSQSYAITPSTLTVSYSSPVVKYEQLNLTMSIKNGNKDIGSAFVGENLKLEISTPEANKNYKIKPTYCEATNGEKKDADIKRIKLWEEAKQNSQSADPEVFGETWTNKTERNWTVNIFAFRFVDTDFLVITCSVRFCFIGGVDDKTNNMCNKGYYPHKHKRSLSNTDEVKNRRVTKTIRVYDFQSSHSIGIKDHVSVVVIVTAFILSGGRLFK